MPGLSPTNAIVKIAEVTHVTTYTASHLGYVEWPEEISNLISELVLISALALSVAIFPIACVVLGHMCLWASKGFFRIADVPSQLGRVAIRCRMIIGSALTRVGAYLGRSDLK